MVTAKRFAAALPSLPGRLFDVATRARLGGGERPFPWRDLSTDPWQTTPVFYPQLPSEGPFWSPSQSPSVARVVEALRARFRELRGEFLGALPALEVTAGSGDRVADREPRLR
ncbi:unnamed protein product [Prorocentrum cordatum]|uniref:Uncharacterized protein n=1 Tax=Prorocentrum cordatum TaxID=2364126 RepID=A0ABN9Q280_9DINO|nr:unnamed protein product [Polarella glacialis]